jgi:hypothetical protein
MTQRLRCTKQDEMTQRLRCTKQDGVTQRLRCTKQVKGMRLSTFTLHKTR